MTDMNIAWVSQYGYPGIFALLVLGIVGLPIPDETLLTFAGYLVFKHKLAFSPTVMTAFLGTACGITVSYALGRTVGLYVIHRYSRWLHVDAQKLDEVRRWYAHRGKYALVIGYFLPGIRHLTAYLAGSAGLSIRTFGVYAWSGGLLWSVTFIAFGYLLGEGWERAMEHLHQGLLIISSLVLVILLVLYLIWRQRTPNQLGDA